MNKTKLSALLSLTLVFVSGGVLGAFAYRLYSAPTVQVTGAPGGPSQQPRPSPEEVRRRMVADLTAKVKLDAQQVQELNSIMDQTHNEFEALRVKSKPDWDALNAKRDELMNKQRPEQDAIRNRQAERIIAMLREDQRPLFAAWRADREKLRKAREQKDQHKKE